MQRADLSFQEIFNNLLAGSKLVLHFPDATSAETFRTRLHHHKARQEKTFVGLGLASEEDRTVLKFQLKKGADVADGFAAYIQFALPSPLKKYPVIVVDEADLVREEVIQEEENGNTQVSATVE